MGSISKNAFIAVRYSSHGTLTCNLRTRSIHIRETFAISGC